MICNKGINDMSIGWRLENELNHRIYKTWTHMIQRCYSEKSLKERPTYKNCYVCDRWLKLSNFVDDISKIDGYDEWLNNKNMALDKDIKSNGKNKCYCLDNCMFVLKNNNSKQVSKTRDWRKQQKIAQYDKNMNLIKIYDCGLDAFRETGIDSSSITKCCKGKRKTAGGFKWRYMEDDNNELL